MIHEMGYSKANTKKKNFRGEVFGLIVKVTLGAPASQSVLESNFPLMCTLRASDDGSSCYAQATHMGEMDSVPGCWL